MTETKIDQSWHGKVIFITGAGSGIGRATAISFAKRGANIVLSGRKEAPLREAETACRKAGAGETLVIAGCDVSVEKNIIEAIEQIEKKFGRLDVAFNNAGIPQAAPTPLADIQTEDYDNILSINARGIFLSMKYEIPLMLKTGGSIINTSSVTGINGFFGCSPYSASKFAIIGMTKCAALEYAKQGIQINAICPGPIETPLLDDFAREDMKRILELQPNGRLGKPEEVGEAVFNLAQPSSAFIVGAAIVLDGGMTAGLKTC
ncbi:short-chain dehydrogenase [Lasius niger]|uniref:Short-chain dehydrogenase n=1 Tax=Lasius niger TaxID=67767 RepID=A0A0J7NJG1_LASNI|nr:short-chain dehydrogenase [Lasius niger]